MKNFAQIAAPLYHLSEKKKAWIWNEECEVAFDTLKKKLTSAPILAFPDFTEAFILDADASSCGLGAVLAKSTGGKEQVVAFASRTLTKAERRYCATRREMLALVWAIVMKFGAGNLHGHQRSCAHCNRLTLVYTLLSSG